MKIYVEAIELHPSFDVLAEATIVIDSITISKIFLKRKYHGKYYYSCYNNTLLTKLVRALDSHLNYKILDAIVAQYYKAIKNNKDENLKNFCLIEKDRHYIFSRKSPKSLHYRLGNL